MTNMLVQQKLTVLCQSVPCRCANFIDYDSVPVVAANTEVKKTTFGTNLSVERPEDGSTTILRSMVYLRCKQFQA
jgi:hypothetical protein